MDSFELNKIAGAVLFTILVVLGLQTIADVIYHAEVPETSGYQVEVAEDAGGEAGGSEGEAATPLPVLLASASAEKGEAVARKCTACHTFEQGGANKIGPNLHGIVGRDIAAVPGFSYSDALQGKEGDWSYENLDGFLAAPKQWAPGTAMAFAGLKRPDQRADMIAYLASITDNPPPLPEPTAESAPAEGEQPAGEQAEQPAQQGQEASPGEVPGMQPAAEAQPGDEATERPVGPASPGEQTPQGEQVQPAPEQPAEQQAPAEALPPQLEPQTEQTEPAPETQSTPQSGAQPTEAPAEQPDSGSDPTQQPTTQ